MLTPSNLHYLDAEMTGDRVTEIMNYLGLSDTQAGNLLGVRRTTVRAWWRDDQRVPPEIARGLEEIAEIVRRIRATKPAG